MDLEGINLVSEIEKNINQSFLDFVDVLMHVGDEIRLTEKKSYLGHIGEFLDNWIKGKNEYVRIISVLRRDKPVVMVRKRCLDPAVASEEVVNAAKSCILMSGTLLPLKMYADILGFPPETYLMQYSSPFPKENRLDVIVPTVTTRYTKRSEDEYGKIARLISKVLLAVPGNSAVFFPSYELMASIKGRVSTDKNLLVEKQGMSKSEKSDLLYRLQLLSGQGAVLYGVIGGSFSEGIDYPENILKAVVVVGVPLEKPTLEVNRLVEYFQKKFSRGWEYAYLFPAVNKAVQAAGRPIRSSDDRAIAIYLDKRYLWDNYRKCFPRKLNMIVSPDPSALISKFFEK